ncbi:MAG: acyl-CoA thioesterase [Armatimonadetes bacterium]|nr:acyl-CoA thioesterase [Armatimonadota bacterium]
MTFTRDIKIRFQHCDPAGIVFYPRYFEMFNQVVEDWFSDELHMPFQTMHLQNKLGVPIVRAECDFLSASRIGETVTFSLQVQYIGAKSFRLSMTASMGSEVRLKALLTLACVTLGEPLRSVAMPDNLRAAMSPYLVSA